MYEDENMFESLKLKILIILRDICGKKDAVMLKSFIFPFESRLLSEALSFLAAHMGVVRVDLNCLRGNNIIQMTE